MKRLLSTLSVFSLVFAMAAFGYAQSPSPKCCNQNSACCEKSDCCEQDASCCHKANTCCHKTGKPSCCDGDNAAKKPAKQ